MTAVNGWVREFKEQASRMVSRLRLPIEYAEHTRHQLTLEAAQGSLDAPIVFFAPNAGFPSMVAAPAIIARTLRDRGHDVLMVSCAMSLRTCVFMDATDPSGPRPTRWTCGGCMHNASAASSRYDLPMVDLGKLITAELRSEAAERVRNFPGRPQEFVHEGTPIGALVTGNLSNQLKRELSNATDDKTIERIQLMAEECLVVKLAMRSLLSLVRARHVVYYAEYANELAVAAACSELGIPVTPVHHSSLNGNDFRRIAFVDKAPQLFDARRRKEDWPQWKPLALSAKQVRIIADDTVIRLLGRSGLIYSPRLGSGGTDIFAKMGLDPARKVLTAFTSSDDEHNNVKAFRTLFGFPMGKVQWPFQNQADWLRHLAKYVSESEDLQLLVRFHPRLGKGTRSKETADYSDQVAAVEDGAMPNVRIVRPEEGVSSYGLAEISKVVLTAWTSLGPESARLGMPVVQSFFGENPFPIGGFLGCPNTPESYFAAIRNALEAKPDPMMLREAFRFAHMYHAANEIDFGDLIERFDDPTLPEFRTPAAASDIERFSVGGEVAQSVNLERQRQAQGPEREAEETASLVEAAARFIYVLAFHADPIAPMRIRIGDTDDGTHCKDGEILVKTYGPNVTVSLPDRQITKRSPMIANLAHLSVALEASLAVVPSNNRDVL
jgi:hypothetical protein